MLYCNLWIEMKHCFIFKDYPCLLLLVLYVQIVSYGCIYSIEYYKLNTCIILTNRQCRGYCQNGLFFATLCTSATAVLLIAGSAPMDSALIVFYLILSRTLQLDQITMQRIMRPSSAPSRALDAPPASRHAPHRAPCPRGPRILAPYFRAFSSLLFDYLS